MVIKRDKMTPIKSGLIEWLVFIYLILFPFGQLIRLNLNLMGRIIPFHPTDFIAGIFLSIFLISCFPKPRFYKSAQNFLLVCLFSLLFSIILFNSVAVILGGLYLLRFFAYLAFSLVIWDFLKRKNKLKEKLFNSLIAVSLTTAVFGWIQYLFYPDIRPLLEWGWDEHLYRLIGTFLDPGFTSLILVFGFLLSFAKFNQNKDKKMLLLLPVFLFSIAFTYARAGYLALISGLLVLSFLQKKMKLGLFQIIFFLLIVFLLPRPGGEGVNLARVNSIYARLTNYSEVVTIIKQSPVFGVGFNNLCLAKEKYLGIVNPNSHACSGSDLNVLGILAMTGIVGTIIFLKMIFEIGREIKREFYGKVFLSAGAALIIHSLFVNSLFYPWVMGFLGILLAISLSGSKTDR
jgi:hypothetical protein